MTTNKQLNKQKLVQNDEFYTQIDDVYLCVKKLNYDWRAKTVWLPFDEPLKSNYALVFASLFKTLKLKKLIISSYAKNPIFNFWGELMNNVNPNNKNYECIITADDFLMGEDAQTILTRNTREIDNGDFFALTEHINACDIVVSNPPFSIIKNIYQHLKKYKKDFCLMGSFVNLNIPFNDKCDFLPLPNIKFNTPRGQKSVSLVCYYTNLTFKDTKKLNIKNDINATERGKILSEFNNPKNENHIQVNNINCFNLNKTKYLLFMPSQNYYLVPISIINYDTQKLNIKLISFILRPTYINNKAIFSRILVYKN